MKTSTEFHQHTPRGLLTYPYVPRDGVRTDPSTRTQEEVYTVQPLTQREFGGVEHRTTRVGEPCVTILTYM